MKPVSKAPKIVPSVVEHHYHGTVIHRHEAARQMPSICTREMGTQTDDIDIKRKNEDRFESVASASRASRTEAPEIPTTPAAPRDKWHQRIFDSLRAWFNRHRYIFQVALNVAIFLLNRVNIGISLRPDPPR